MLSRFKRILGKSLPISRLSIINNGMNSLTDVIWISSMYGESKALNMICGTKIDASYLQSNPNYMVSRYWILSSRESMRCTPSCIRSNSFVYGVGTLTGCPPLYIFHMYITHINSEFDDICGSLCRSNCWTTWKQFKTKFRITNVTKL